MRWVDKYNKYNKDGKIKRHNNRTEKYIKKPSNMTHKLKNYIP
jgi:hypothetical protein